MSNSESSESSYIVRDKRGTYMGGYSFKLGSQMPLHGLQSVRNNLGEFYTFDPHKKIRKKR